MLDLKSYITEGIFDEDDIMNDIDNNAEITKWFKKLTDSDNIIKNINDFTKILKKDNVKSHRSRNGMWYDKPYVRFVILDRKYEYQDTNRHINIHFLLPNGNNGWDDYRICYSYGEGSLNCDTIMIEKSRWKFYLSDIDLDGSKWKITKSISYTLPDKWKGITKLIENYGRS